MSRSDCPIAVFDSGVGGLTVVKALKEHLPQETIIYFGDLLHLPYGNKSLASIQYYTRTIAAWLRRHFSPKLFVIACNSASAAAATILKKTLDIPVIEAIEPTVKAILKTGIQDIGIIGTKATIQSGVYEERLKAYQPQLRIAVLATPLLVPLIEEGWIDHPATKMIVDTYLDTPAFQNIRLLVMACTHYPLLKKVIESHFEHQKVRFLYSSFCIAQATIDFLKSQRLLSSRRHASDRFFVTDLSDHFKNLASTILKGNIHLEQIDWHLLKD